MKIGQFEIKPIALCLSDEDRWIKQKQAAEIYFKSQGVEDIYWLNGVHARAWGIKGTKPYLLDGKPEENFYIGDANVGNFISQYIAYTVMDALDYSHYLYLEGDCEFLPDWKTKLEKVLTVISKDFDMLYVGSCCLQGKLGNPLDAESGLYEMKPKHWREYPLCTHCYIVAKKAIPHFIATQRDASNPTDISITRFTLDKLKVYAIHPRLAQQFNTSIPI